MRVMSLLSHITRPSTLKIFYKVPKNSKNIVVRELFARYSDI